MSSARRDEHLTDDDVVLSQWRDLAARAFSRAAAAPLIPGNRIRMLKDANENYPAWLAAIRGARRHVHLESYFVCDDEIGREFARALVEKAQDGIAVRVIYDWFGNLGKAPARFWNDLRLGGVEVRCYNPPRLESLLGWLARDHRKMLAVDREVGFITGLCIGRSWVGDPARGIEPWRDTGVEITGPAVAEVERAFSRMWALGGPPIPAAELTGAPAVVGDTRLRIVASDPATWGMLRVDQLVAGLATSRLWLTDAYYAGTTSYVQALQAAAKDGIDVRLLVPNATDLPLLQPLSRSGYRPLLEAGVRVFEWNGTMLHAKTAVADGSWARVGSTNLNIASWFGNCELDAVVEDVSFAQQMENLYLDDLGNATEIVLNMKRRMIRAGKPDSGRTRGMPRGSASRAAAGAMRIGHTLSAAFTNRRVLEPVEARLTALAGFLLCLLALLFAVFPRALAYPLIVSAVWAGLALLYRGYRLWRIRPHAGTATSDEIGE
jgi:cardiolipin synthase A/B